MRSVLSALLVAVGLLAAAGCGGDGGGYSSTTTTTTTTTTDGALPGATTGPVTGPAAGYETALLQKIDVAHHDGYDRIVFRFKNLVPGYRVEYVNPPLKEDGSGNPVTLAGNAFLSMRMEPASGFDLNTGEGVLVYTGPRRIDAPADSSALQELVRTGDFEAVLTWVAGVTKKVPFRVQKLESPPRLVVDLAAA